MNERNETRAGTFQAFRPFQTNADLALSQALVAIHAAQALLACGSEDSPLALARVREALARCEDAEEAILRGQDATGDYQNGYREGKADAKAGRERAFHEGVRDNVPCVLHWVNRNWAVVPPQRLTHARGYLDGFARAKDQELDQ